MNKPTLILIPGLLCDHAVWQFQTTALQEHVNIIIPMLPRLDQAGSIIDEILKQSPKQFLLAGHSMGGWLALELMRKHSHRVTKLCILASSASLDTLEKIRLRKQMIKRISTASADDMAKCLAELYSYKSEIQPLIVNMFKRNMDAFITQQHAMLQRICCEDVLPRIHVPTTIIVGEHDEEFLKSSKRMADIIPNARFITLEHCGHMLMLEEPEQCNQAMLDWVAE